MFMLFICSAFILGFGFVCSVFIHKIVGSNASRCDDGVDIPGCVADDGVHELLQPQPDFEYQRGIRNGGDVARGGLVLVFVHAGGNERGDGDQVSAHPTYDIRQDGGGCHHRQLAGIRPGARGAGT